MKLVAALIILITPSVIFAQQSFADTSKLEKIIRKTESEKFEIGFKKKNIPGFIKSSLSRIDKNKFRIANAGNKFNATDAILKNSLPTKRIVYVAKTSNILILTYEQGGFGKMTYTRIIEYQKKSILCITTLIVPPHADLSTLKQIILKHNWIKFVSIKSECF